ncbi:MAG: hypothetical protein IJ087_19090 [Eggerthellaceae bacterium]|nr:hypothetical protein [Eggerthellaceae bacterium]
MPPLQVKDFPADVYERLRQCAREENRSISQQTLTIIEDYLDMRDRGVIPPRYKLTGLVPLSEKADLGVDYAEKHRRALGRINELPPLPASADLPSAAEMIRQIRDEEAR